MVKKTKSLPKSYEAAVQELQELLSKIEEGNLPLDNLLDSYQRSVDLLEFCRASLAAVEQQVKIIEQKIDQPVG